MLIDFSQKEEITLPGMNNGTGTMTAKMYMDAQGKVIPCSIHAGGSIGLHKHETSDDIKIMYCPVTEKLFATVRKKFYLLELVISVRKALSIVS